MKEIKTKPEGGKPKLLESAAKAPKTAMKDLWLKSKEKSVSEIKETPFASQQGESSNAPANTAGDQMLSGMESTAKKGADLTYRGGKKLAQTTAKKVREKREIARIRKRAEGPASQAASQTGKAAKRLVCGECGSMYRRTTWSKKGKKKVVWRCINRLEFGTKYCQHSPTLPEQALHQAILQCVQTVAGDKDDIMQNLRDVQENIILFSGSQATPQSLEKQVNKLEQEMSALVKIVAQGGDSDFYAAKLRQLSEQKMDLTRQLQELQKKKIENQALEYQYQQALIYINNEENLNLTEFNDDFIRRIIEQVTVLSASQIRIRFVGGYELDTTLPLQK